MRASPSLAVLCLALPLACEVEDDREPLPFEPASAEAAPAPAEMGPFPVGVRTLTLKDPSRTTKGREGPRTLVTEVWYPAVEAARDAGNEDYVLYDSVPEDLRGTLVPEDLGMLSTSAVRDAAPRADRGAFPLIVFSHGKGGIRMQSTFYTVLLASHGYVVVSPDHEGDTLVDLLEEGDVDLTTIDSFIDRPLDVSFLLDNYLALPDDHFLAGLIDVERVGATGHSFGALTSFVTAGNDWRVRAIVAHTPVGVGLVHVASEIPVERFGIPIMIQSAGLDRTLPSDLHAASLWEHMQAPRYWLELETAGHFTYSDMCVLDIETISEKLDINASNVLTDGCGPDNLATERAFPAINHYSVAFFNAYLRDSDGSLAYLDEEAGAALAGDEEVRFLGETQ